MLGVWPLVGCSGFPASPIQCQVEGRVTRREQPVVDAWVVFVPLLPEISDGVLLPIATGKTDESGHYRLLTTENSMGLAPGRYRVLISQRFPTSETPESPDNIQSRSESLPSRFHEESELYADVPAEARTTIDWCLDDPFR